MDFVVASNPGALTKISRGVNGIVGADDDPVLNHDVRPNPVPDAHLNALSDNG
jgi:hypothetical protein